MTTKGFLFIGDPHVCSKKVGRRKDDYLSSVLSKLEEAANVAKELRLVPVILGDLMHRNDDNNLVMLNRLLRVLQEFEVPPYVLEGNHDKEQTSLTDADALNFLAQAGAVRLMSTPLEYIEFQFEDGPARLAALPYGCELPDALSIFDGPTIAVSHHDMAFDTSYPGSQPLQAIRNCAGVVNGHMHDTKPSKKVGDTTWHNPGNIEPLSVDLAGHVPSVAVWVPTAPDALELIPLSHNPDCFDLTGLQVSAATGVAVVEAHAHKASSFAALLQAQDDQDAARTDDATILLEDLADVLESSSASDATKILLQSLAADLVLSAAAE